MATKRNTAELTQGLVAIHNTENSAHARALRLKERQDAASSAPANAPASAATAVSLVGYAAYDPSSSLVPGAHVLLPLDLIEENPLNPRVFYAPGPMQELVSSLARFGLQQHVQVYAGGESGKYRLKSGHRRTRGLRQLGHKVVPVEVVAYSGDQMKDFQEAREINKHHRSQTHFDDAVRFRELLEVKAVSSQGALAELLGLSEGELSKTLAIGRLPHEVLGAMASAPQQFGPSAAYAVYRYWVEQKEDVDAVMALVQKVIAGKLSFRALEQLAKSSGPGAPAAATRSHALNRASFKGFATGELKAFENRLTLRIDGVPLERRDALFAQLMDTLRQAGLADSSNPEVKAPEAEA